MISANLARQTLEELRTSNINPNRSLSYLEKEAQKQHEYYIKDIDELESLLKSMESQPIDSIHSLEILGRYFDLIEKEESIEIRTHLIVSCLTGMYAYEDYKSGYYGIKNIVQALIVFLKRQGINPTKQLLQKINFGQSVNKNESIFDIINKVQESVKIYGSASPEKAIKSFLQYYSNTITKEVLLQRLGEERLVIPILHEAIIKAISNQQLKISCIIDTIPGYTDTFIPHILNHQGYTIKSYDIVGDGDSFGTWGGS